MITPPYPYPPNANLYDLLLEGLSEMESKILKEEEKKRLEGEDVDVGPVLVSNSTQSEETQGTSINQKPPTQREIEIAETLSAIRQLIDERNEANRYKFQEDLLKMNKDLSKMIEEEEKKSLEGEDAEQLSVGDISKENSEENLAGLNDLHREMVQAVVNYEQEKEKANEMRTVEFPV